MSCASVYIAPTILACPAKVDLNDEFKDELEHYIVQLTDLRDSIGSNLFQILASRNTGDLLIEAGCYPVFPSIRKGLAESGLDEIYQTGDVVKIIEQILRDSDVVEDFIGVTDILTDSVTVSGSIRYIAAPELVEQQKINKTMLALGDHLGILSSDKTWIIGKLEEEGAIHEENYLEIKARIADIEWSEDKNEVDLPFELSKKFNLGASFHQVRRRLDLMNAIQGMSPGVMFETISCALTQNHFSEGQEAKLDWIIGPEFEHSISQLHVQNNPPVFRALLLACVNVICGVALDKTHPLRTGAGGNNPQIVEQGALAWRRDVNYEFHLHYWTMGRFCEFASCVVHEDFTIPPPTRQCSFRSASA